MKLNRFDRLVVGFAFLLGIFTIEFAATLGGALYLLVAIYILRFSGQRKSVLILGVASSLAILLGFYLSEDFASLNPVSVTNRVLLISFIWISVYVNFRFRYLIKVENKNGDLIRSLNSQNQQVHNELQSLSLDLENQLQERKRIEQELLKRKKLQDAMAHNFPDGVICVLNTEMKFILADGGEMEELGLSRNDRKNENALLNLASIPELKKAFKGENVSTEITINNKSYTLNGVPIPDANNEINEVLVVIRNITDQKKSGK